MINNWPIWVIGTMSVKDTCIPDHVLPIYYRIWSLIKTRATFDMKQLMEKSKILRVASEISKEY